MRVYLGRSDTICIVFSVLKPCFEQKSKMMQQIYQQEPTSSQDPTGQQMVLCPVRVVYETQMLVQSGDQMQPNQTILINPQNPPPWIQNRPVQNQVLYVQHMPTNYMQPPQQHIDPNQLYLQNFAYQNIQPMYVQSPQEQIRPMQMVPPNVVHNIQGNINTNLQNQRMLANTPLPQTINTVPNQNIHTQRPVVPTQIAHINELVNNIRPQENISVGPNTYRQPTPQIMQQDQKIQMQPTITMVPNTCNMQAMPRFPSTYEQSSQVRPTTPQNIVNIQPTHQNAMPNVQEVRKTPTTANKGIQHIPIPAKVSQTFRPIQPRTNQIRANGPNIISVQPTNSVSHSGTNSISINNGPRKYLGNSAPIANSISISSTGKIEGNNIPLTRKRKSESPDDLQRKITVNNPPENPIIIKRIETVSNVSCTDVGVNTSPIHKPDGRIIINNMQITPLRPSHDPNTKLKEELAKPVKNMPVLETQNVRSANVVTPNSLPMLPTEKDKLVRNTVFTQARGRVLTDKEVGTEVRNASETENKQPGPSVSSVKEPKSEFKNETETKEIKEKTDIKESKQTKDTKETEDDGKNCKTENTDSKMHIEEKKSSSVPINVKMPDIKLKDDRNFVLTHVLDGYVIQESNVAFPIRKPLKEKTLQINISDPRIKKEVKEEKETDIRNNSKILDISHLQIKEIENMGAADNKDSKENDKDDPFANITVDTVKTWTTEQLTTHLSKYAWTETISVLLEHEIDGESLFLVSKGQLVTIGVSEGHADVICQFVKS